MTADPSAIDFRVSFVIGGAQKSGTTALALYCREHPEICFSREKEPHLFDRDPLFQGSGPDYRIYHQLFQPKPGERICGEGTPILLYWEPAPSRVWKYHPGMKWILVLRDPVSRAFSHWKMNWERGRETLPFPDALAMEERRSREELPAQSRAFSYIDRGFYCAQIRRLWRYFPREQTLILKSEDLLAEPDRVLREVWSFLGVDAGFTCAPVRAFPSSGDEVIDPESKARLRHAYEFEVRQLERMLGWDCSHWLH